MRKILSVCILISGMCLKGQEMQKFDVNDPRNPDCPCHKYQQLAEQEYKKLLASAENKRPVKKKGRKLNENGTSFSEKNNGTPGSGVNENGRSFSEQKLNEEGISLSEKGILKNDQHHLSKTGNNSSGNASTGGNMKRSNFSGGASQEKNILQNHIRQRKKKHIKKHPLWSRVKNWQGWNICKESRVVSACFHWK